MNYVNSNILNQMFNYYYDENLNEIDSNYNSNFSKYNITPAQITNILINSLDKNEFIQNLNNLIKNT